MLEYSNKVKKMELENCIKIILLFILVNLKMINKTGWESYIRMAKKYQVYLKMEILLKNHQTNFNFSCEKFKN